jgi:lipoyl(octanoyl) transferase
MLQEIIIQHLGKYAYQEIWYKMREFTVKTPDEIWLLEHFPVFTLGYAGNEKHILNPGNIPIIQTDRGGQVTYHSQGQLVVYFLIDLRRKKCGIKQFVNILENSIIQLLAEYNITATSRPDAPGVYVNNAKICSIGLKVYRSCTYHGLALNVDIDLEPFSRINPCGYKT